MEALGRMHQPKRMDLIFTQILRKFSLFLNYNLSVCCNHIKLLRVFFFFTAIVAKNAYCLNSFFAIFMSYIIIMVSVKRLVFRTYYVVIV